MIKKHHFLYAIGISAAIAAAWAFGGFEPDKSDEWAANGPQMTERTYKLFALNCVNCHAVPHTTAPLVGDATAWAERRRKGEHLVLKNTIEGFGRMPPLGSCGACTQEDLHALVRFMAGVENEN